MHFDFDLTRWLIGAAWHFHPDDCALFVHLGPLCIGFHRADYYEN